jgi:hypothetical protein
MTLHPIPLSLYMRKILLSFLSVYKMRQALEYQFLIPSHQHQGTLKTNILSVQEDLLFTYTFCNFETEK